MKCECSTNVLFFVPYSAPAKENVTQPAASTNVSTNGTSAFAAPSVQQPSTNSTAAKSQHDLIAEQLALLESKYLARGSSKGSKASQSLSSENNIYKPSGRVNTLDPKGE